MSFYRATLTAPKPFSSFTVPGTSPSVVVNRRGALLDETTTKALKKALKADRIPNVSADDVAIVKVDEPGKTAGSTDDTEALRERVAELEERLAESGSADADQLETLTAERDELSAKYDTALGERDALQAQLAESDSGTLATGILGSMTVPQLTDLAKARKVEHDSKATKDEIISAIVTG